MRVGRPSKGSSEEPRRIGVAYLPGVSSLPYASPNPMARTAKPTVTIAIPAFNEGRTIGRLVRALLDQDSTNFVLDAILINSDGSTDDTVAACQAIDSEKVRVIDNRDRRGKATRQTELFRMNSSDIHVCFDADVIPAHPSVLCALVEQFGPNVGLVGGTVRAAAAKTLLEHTYVKEKQIWEDAVSRLNGGANVYTHEGRISAASRQLAAAIEIPAGISGTDDYVYLFARQMGLEFKLAPNASVLYQAPTAFTDWRKQRRRFLASWHVQTALFGPSVRSEFEVPLSYKLRAVARAAVRSPLLTSACSLLWLYGRIDAGLAGFARSSVGWDIARSTKDFQPESAREQVLQPNTCSGEL
jgi:glycosyltransferase involved in cell wall biosynthesis